MDAILSGLVSGRGRLWLTNAAPGAVAFWSLGALALGGTRLAVPQPRHCAFPAAGIVCQLTSNNGLRFVAAALLALLGIIAGTSLVAMLTAPALAVIAGDWPSRGIFGVLARDRQSRQRQHRDRLVNRLGRADAGSATQLIWYPAGDAAIRPTRAGNAFAGLEQRVKRRHGLSLPTCWPLIEQTLPRPAQEQLERASRRVAGRVQNMLWAVASLAWLPFFPAWLALLALAAGAILAVLLWWAVNGTVEQYCALIEALVAAHRRALYTAIGWPLPKSTDQEPACGLALTGYLNRLSAVGDITLEWTDEPATGI